MFIWQEYFCHATAYTIKSLGWRGLYKLYMSTSNPLLYIVLCEKLIHKCINNIWNASADVVLKANRLKKKNLYFGL